MARLLKIERLNVFALTLAVFLVLGLLAIVLTLHSNTVYREAATRSKGEDISRVMGSVARWELEELHRHAADLGVSVEHRSNLRSAWDQWRQFGGTQAMRQILDNPFVAGYAKAEQLKLEKLRLFDLTGQLVVESQYGAPNMPHNLHPDLEMLVFAHDGIERLQSVGGIWRHRGRSFHSTILPFGGLHIRGYLEVVTDPVQNLERIGEVLEMKVGIHTDPLFLDEGYSEPGLRRVEYVLPALDLVPAYWIHGYVRYADFDEEIESEVLTLSIIQITGICFTLAFGYMILMISLSRPIRMMSSELRRYESDDGAKQLRVAIRGLREVNELADAFNRLMGQVQVQKDTLRQMSLIDALTGLANRRAFDLALEREWLRAHRQREQLSLLLIDIDHFKRYNDSYGHQEGDACLRQVAKGIAGVTNRAADLAARYGGEEFVVILPATDQEGAMRVAQLIVQRIWDLDIPHVASDVAGRVTLSIGLASTCPSTLRGYANLTESADRALYHAKNTGRNRVVVAGEMIFADSSDGLSEIEAASDEQDGAGSQAESDSASAAR